MKTKPETYQLKIKNRSGLKNRNEKIYRENSLDFQLRRYNRALPTNRLLELLRGSTPHFFELAEVVGNWVWIQFSEQPVVEIRQQLAELGFHWNNTRGAWQHPCGLQRSERATFDPRKVYGSYFAADMN